MPAIRTASELGAAIRRRRKELGLGQAELARRVGVTRQWVIDIEKGKPRAELELVMHTLHALELRFFVQEPSAPQVDPSQRIDSVLARLEKRGTPSSPTVLESFRQRLTAHPEASAVSRKAVQATKGQP